MKEAGEISQILHFYQVILNYLAPEEEKTIELNDQSILKEFNLRFYEKFKPLADSNSIIVIHSENNSSFNPNRTSLISIQKGSIYDLQLNSENKLFRNSFFKKYFN